MIDVIFAIRDDLINNLNISTVILTHLYGLTQFSSGASFIISEWISIHIANKACNEITYHIQTSTVAPEKFGNG